METNENNVQEQPAPPQLYDPAEAAHIAELLRHAYNPEYIILFGTLVGGTPHSDIVAYDLLVVPSEEPYYGGWAAAKRWLKLKMPSKHRQIGYVNPHIYTRNFIDGHSSPVFYLAKKEGVVLYFRKHINLPKPKPYNFAAARDDASGYFSTFYNLGTQFLDDAGTAFTTNDLRQTAFFLAQAAQLFYRTLFFVYHRFETDCENLELLHDMLRTLSAELMLQFDTEHHNGNNTIPRLNAFLNKARYDANFCASPRELEAHLDRMEKMKTIIEKVCKQRIELYCSRIVTE